MPKPSPSVAEACDIPRWLSTAVSHTGEAVLGIDHGGRIVVANPAAEALLGLTAGELVGHGYRDRFRLADAAGDDPIAAILAGGGSQPLPPGSVLARTGRSPVPVTGSCSPSGDGAAGGVLVICRSRDNDPLSAALQVAEARLSEVQRTARLGNWEIDLRGGEHYWSDELYRIFESDRATLGGSVQAFVNHVHPDDHDAVDLAFERSVKAGIPYDLTHRIVTARGRVRHVHSRGELVLDAAGKPLRSVGTLQDVTDQYLAAEQVRFQATLMANVLDAVIATDPDFRILAWNPAAESLYGWSAAEAVGQLLPELVRITHLAGTQEQAIGDLRTHGQWRGELLMAHRDGHHRQVLASVNSVRDADGRFIGYVGVNRDVTEGRALERERAELAAIENLGRLAGGIAHDFNNALQAIVGHAELARAVVDPATTAATDLDQVRLIAAQAGELARHLQALAGEQVAQPIVMDLTAAVELATDAVHAAAGPAVSISWRLGRDLWPVRIDPAQVERILLQLVINAREAVRDGGLIEIATGNTERTGSHAAGRADPSAFVTLSVRDNGLGMDADTVERAFEPLFSTKTGTGTTGLGLAIVAGIVRQNAGAIDIDSAPDRGTTVRVHLPRWTEPVKPAAVPAADPVDMPRRTVMLVEDEEPVRQVTLRGLERAGFQVICYGDPFEALEHMTQGREPIDLLITDVMMPGLTGKQLVDRLLVLQPDLRYLFVSGYPADVIARHGVVDSSIQLLQKPFTLTELTARVRRMLGALP